MSDELARPPRPGGNYSEKEVLAARRANALITLAHLGKPDCALARAPA